jgi:hypothetical protein
MIWHHNWPGAQASAAKAYDASDHALARFRPDVAAAAAELAPLVTEDVLTAVAADVPDDWLVGEPGFGTPDDVRRAHVGALLARAGSIHERITLNAPSTPRTPQPPGWLTGHGKPWPHPTKQRTTAKGAEQ